MKPPECMTDIIQNGKSYELRVQLAALSAAETFFKQELGDDHALVKTIGDCLMEGTAESVERAWGEINQCEEPAVDWFYEWCEDEQE